MVTVHLWLDKESPDFKLHQVPKIHSITTHVRSKPLNKSYLSHMIHTITTATKPCVHIFVVGNRDFRDVKPAWLIWAIDFLGQINQLKLESDFVCIDLTIHSGAFTRTFKKKLRSISHRNPCVTLKDLGVTLRPEDLKYGFYLSKSAARWVEKKIIQSIYRSIIKLSRA